eukprot:5182862-Amphidinium_carterae.1
MEQLRETKNDNQYHSKRKKTKKFREHRYTPKYWKMSKMLPNKASQCKCDLKCPGAPETLQNEAAAIDGL